MADSIVSARTYLLVFAALLGLTGATVAASLVPLGQPWHTLVGLAIAVVKACLVVLFFMHSYYGSRLMWLVASGAVLWLGILLVLTLSDYGSRDWWPITGR